MFAVMRKSQFQPPEVLKIYTSKDLAEEAVKAWYAENWTTDICYVEEVDDADTVR